MTERVRDVTYVIAELLESSALPISAKQWHDSAIQLGIDENDFKTAARRLIDEGRVYLTDELRFILTEPRKGK